MWATVFAISMYFSRFSILEGSAALSVQFLTAQVSQVMPTIFLGNELPLKKFNFFFKCGESSSPILTLLLMSFLNGSGVADDKTRYSFF